MKGIIIFRRTILKKSFLKVQKLIVCAPWKGIASYYDLEVSGEVNKDAAWYYPEVSELAKGIKGYVAFWKGVEVK